MRIVPFLPVAGVAVWMAAMTATMVQSPTIAFQAAPACSAAAADWEADLRDAGFTVDGGTADQATPCLSARLGGYVIEGAVAPDALSRLLMKKPRGVVGLSRAADGEVVAMLADGGRVAFRTVLEKEKRH